MLKEKRHNLICWVHQFHLELDALSPFVLSFIARNERFLESSEANAQLSTMSREDGNETHLRGLLQSKFDYILHSIRILYLAFLPWGV